MKIKSYGFILLCQRLRRIKVVSPAFTIVELPPSLKFRRASLISNNNIKQGFTIVELLVVIVVIGILAAITIVSYTGISSKAIVSSVKSDIAQAYKQLEVSKTTSSTDVYPTDLNTANLKSSNGTTYTYYSDSPYKNYCLVATNGTTIYSVSSSNPLPISGNCLSNGLVLNLDAGNTASYPGSGTTWTDLSGLGNNGTLVNGPTYSSDGGGSISLDGLDDYVNISTLSTSKISNGSISFWRKSLNSNRWLMFGGQNSSYFLMAVSTGNFYHSNIGSTVTIYEDSVPVLTDNRNSAWHYYVAKGFDLTTWTSVYISNYTGYQYNGLLSDIKIYNRQLSSAEITQNFNATKSRYGL